MVAAGVLTRGASVYMMGSREQAYEAMERRRSGHVFPLGWLFRIAAPYCARCMRLTAWLPFGEEHEPALPTRGDFAGQPAEQELVR